LAKTEKLLQTRGSFQVKGIVSGVSRNDYYSEKMTRSDNPRLRKSIKFAIQTSPDNKVFVSLAAQPQDKVYFNKRAEEKGGTPITRAIDWDKRDSFKEDGFRIIGVNIGLIKKLDKDGKEINDIQNLHPYDAVGYINEHLADGMSVFIRGRIEYSRYEDKNIKQYVIDQISLCKPVDFEAGDFTEVANWEQYIAFRAIEKDESEDNKFVLTGSIVNYNNIVETDFIIRNSKIAQVFKKNLKPFTRVKIFGNLIGKIQEVVADEEDDGWGEPNPMQATNGYYKEMLVTGADKTSLDTEVYSEDIFDEFLRGDKEFGDNTDSSDDEDDDWSV